MAFSRALNNARALATTAARGQVRRMSGTIGDHIKGVKDVKVKDAARYFSDKMKDPAAQQAARSGYQNYHDQIIKKGDWSPALHTILFMWCIGYANDYRAHLQYEISEANRTAAGPAVVWPH